MSPAVAKPLALGVLVSGRGSNLQAVIDAIETGALLAKIVLVLSDNPESYGLQRALDKGIPAQYIDPRCFASRENYDLELSKLLRAKGADTVLLAGYMRLVTNELLKSFPERVINIHPALLPSFKGLHGQRQALKYGAKVSGCTVHFVDEGMDTGPIILQAAVPILEDDTEESLSQRILEQEHRILPAALQLLAEGRLSVKGRRVIIARKDEQL